MLKILLSTLLLSISLFANETIEDQLGKCEDTYVTCSAKCEEANNENTEQCIDICEKAYYECETKVTENFEEKSQDNQ